MVAVALAVHPAAGAGRDDGGGTLALVRSYLATKDRDSLVDMIIDIAEWDSALLRKLELAAAASGTDDDVLQSQLRNAIGEATRTGGFVDYGQARRWAAGVDAVLDALAEIASLVAAAGASSLELRVNRGNVAAIGFYRKNGFTVHAEDRREIGNGFVMDDYLMRLELSR